jgi:hypothetical protein
VYTSRVRSCDGFLIDRFELGDVSNLPLSRWGWVHVYSWRRGRRGRCQCLMPLKKPCVVSVGNSGTPISVSTGSWGKSYPTLCEFLSAVAWEDGSTRECGKLTLFVDQTDGRWKVFLNCHHTSRTACVSAEDPGQVLQAAEKGLRDDKLDWRPWKTQAKTKKA